MKLPQCVIGGREMRLWVIRDRGVSRVVCSMSVVPPIATKLFNSSETTGGAKSRRLAVAKVKVGIKGGVVARLSVGTHQIVIRVFGVISLRGESPYKEQSASDNGAFHGIVSGSDGLESNFLGTAPKR
jgi:hypothetical protein